MSDLITRFSQIERLSISDRKRAHNAALSAIRAKTAKEPKEKDFRPNTGDWLSTLQSMLPYFFLLVIGGIALYISGGKQLEAAFKVFQPIVDHANSSFMPESYAVNSSLAILVFGEVACIFFMAMASILPPGYVTMFNKRFNFYAVMCYIWSVVCASIAIIANISIDASTTADVSFLATILKIIPPATALFIGMVFERLIVAWRDKTQVWKASFEQAHKNWTQWVAHPETHPEYEQTLQNNILAALYGYDGNRDLLEPDKQLRDIAYSVELEAMNEKLNRVDVATLLANPTSLSQN